MWSLPSTIYCVERAESTRLVTSVSERWYFSAFSSAVLFTWAFLASASMESVSSNPVLGDQLEEHQHPLFIRDPGLHWRGFLR